MRMVYQVVTITGRVIAFEADAVTDEDGTYMFWLDDEVVAQFEKGNIAGYVAVEKDD